MVRSIYLNNPKYWDRQAWANTVDPDQTPQNVIFKKFYESNSDRYGQFLY